MKSVTASCTDEQLVTMQKKLDGSGKETGI